MKLRVYIHVWSVWWEGVSDMTGIEIQFLVGLYFVVFDLPNLFSNPRTNGQLIRFIAGMILIVISIMGVSILGIR